VRNASPSNPRKLQIYCPTVDTPNTRDLRLLITDCIASKMVGHVNDPGPLLTGEHDHYELAAGRDPMPYIVAMEKFANDGGMLAEQLWDSDDLPDVKMFKGRATRDERLFDRIEPAFQCYVVGGERDSSRNVDLPTPDTPYRS
jgi:hypothetical protein